MGCGASSEARGMRLQEMYHPTEDMKAHELYMERCEAGYYCSEPSPMGKRMRERITSMKCAAKLVVVGAEFDPDGEESHSTDSEMEKDIEGWVSESECGATADNEALKNPLIEDDPRHTPPPIDALDAPMDEDEEQYNLSGHYRERILTLTPGVLRRHNQLTPLSGPGSMRRFSSRREGEMHTAAGNGPMDASPRDAVYSVSSPATSGHSSPERGPTGRRVSEAVSYDAKNLELLLGYSTSPPVVQDLSGFATSEADHVSMRRRRNSRKGSHRSSDTPLQSTRALSQPSKETTSQRNSLCILQQLGSDPLLSPDPDQDFGMRAMSMELPYGQVTRMNSGTYHSSNETDTSAASPPMQGALRPGYRTQDRQPYTLYQLATPITPAAA
eukprot:TRINITY_DN4161_c4_g1_i1.p1 TRINITY_DN4161_c4_g1~~TRINITY_DN4161_c4_g1_i1.p1  ORF type:complete len:402 (+),score=93.89 TRINITY_DN4161_c4_g1_i1:51-1208(+)